MTITHHLDDATLMSFAAGSLPDTLAAVAAAHISMCARCRQEVAMLERIGVREEEHNLRNKVARGKFTAAFFLQCLSAIGVQILRLQEE